MNTVLNNFLSEPDFFTTLSEISSDAVWMLDVPSNKGSWLVSPAIRQKYGIPAEVPDDFWERGIHPEDKERAVTGFRQALADTTVTFFEHQYRYVGGSDACIHVHDKMKFLRHADGTARQVVGTWRDITEEIKKQKALDEARRSLEAERERFKIISELSNAAMWDIDFATRTIKWYSGSSALDDFDLNRPNYSINDWKACVHADDRERVARYFEDVVMSKSNRYADVYRVKKNDGTYSTMMDQGFIFRDDTGKAIRALGGWVDITRERQREQVLEEALQYQRGLNEELALREEELTSTEEELRQINEQLSENVRILSEREFILTQSQTLARIGSWDYDVQTKNMYWSNEMYNIYGVDHSFDVNNLADIHRLYEDRSGHLVKEAFLNMTQQKDLPFDITAQTITPLGYKKWVRITAYPFFEGNKFTRILGLTYDITYFKESEERLKTSEEKFSKAFRNNPDLMTIMREDDMVIIDVNEKVFPVLGYTRQEVIGHKALDFHFFVDPGEREQFYTDYFTNGLAEIECTWRRKDGACIQALLSSSRIEIEGRNFVISVVKDISDRKAAEEKFQKAFDLNPDLTILFRERDMTVVDVNSKLYEFAGYTPDEVVGRSTSEFNIWTSADDRRRYFEKLQHNGEASYEAQFLKKNGEPFHGTIASSRFALSGENYIITIVRDTTEQKLAEARLVSSEANLTATINNTQFFIWSLDRQYRLTQLNEPWKKYVKRTYGVDVQVGDLIQSIFENVTIEKEKLNTWVGWFQQVLSGEVLKVTENVMGRDFQYSLSPIRGQEHITGVTVFAEEITERLLAERKMRQNELNMNAIINNTDMSIWSVDTQFNIMALNNNFINYMRDWYDITYEVGQQIIDVSRQKIPDTMLEYWSMLFRRALAGEMVLVEDELNEAYLQYSVNPIIEKGNVVGAAIYSRNITERVLRERELIDANKKIGELKLMALRSVMNPHFIFNALNSIQFFIAKNDRLNAINYLSTFSKLIRGILTNSVKNKIRLADELDLLRHYVNLELVRFENKFEFVLNVSPDLDIENVEIPSLLIQPYVENAILHGLYNKPGKGTLTIKVCEADDKVLFEIQDDGIGREAARKLRQQNFPQHKSMGTVLTEERLKLVNLEGETAYEVIDLFKGEEPAGTLVKIWIAM